jgi:FtsP/CotA-like multicopper oxidase with cupredoxin domain
MRTRFIFLFFILLFGTTVHAATVYQTLYINRGVLVTVKNTSFPFLAFNSGPAFNSLNTVVNVRPNDQLILKVINNDTTLHGFAIKGYPGIGGLINSSDSLTDTLVCASEKALVYYDNYQYPKFTYLGLAGMICVSNHSSSTKYYWNLKDHETGYNNTLAANGSVNWMKYYPDYFTINGLSFPQLQNDTLAKINASVGDTLHIFIVNTGHSSHSLHFHGFHSRIISSYLNVQTGWIKDTFPLQSMDAMVLELVPDKTGRYSVHDHNLVAITGGNTHPNGMFTIMDIQ